MHPVRIPEQNPGHVTIASDSGGTKLFASPLPSALTNYLTVVLAQKREWEKCRIQAQGFTGRTTGVNRWGPGCDQNGVGPFHRAGPRRGLHWVLNRP